MKLLCNQRNSTTLKGTGKGALIPPLFKMTGATAKSSPAIKVENKDSESMEDQTGKCPRSMAAI